MTKVEKFRKEATEAHDKVIEELYKRGCYVNDDMAKHYLPAMGSIKLVWESMRRLRLGLETVIVEEESHITY